MIERAQKSLVNYHKKKLNIQKDKDFKALKVRAHIDSVGCLLHIKDRLFIQGGHRKGQAVYRC